MHAVNRRPLCSGWEYTEEWSENFLMGEGEAELVRIPHNIGTIPLHYADPSDYSRIAGYRKVITIPAEAARKITPVLVDGGVKGIWNFAHTDLDVPDTVTVQSVHLSESLMQLSYKINH